MLLRGGSLFLSLSSYSFSSIPLLYLPRLHAFFAVDPRGDQPVFPTPSPRLSRRGYPDNTRGASKFFRTRLSGKAGTKGRRDEGTKGGRFGWYAITTIKCDTRENSTVRYHLAYIDVPREFSTCDGRFDFFQSESLIDCPPKFFSTIERFSPHSDLIRAKLTGTRLVSAVLI